MHTVHALHTSCPGPTLSTACPHTALPWFAVARVEASKSSQRRVVNCVRVHMATCSNRSFGCPIGPRRGPGAVREVHVNDVKASCTARSCVAPALLPVQQRGLPCFRQVGSNDSHGLLPGGQGPPCTCGECGGMRVGLGCVAHHVPWHARFLHDMDSCVCCLCSLPNASSLGTITRPLSKRALGWEARCSTTSKPCVGNTPCVSCVYVLHTLLYNVNTKTLHGVQNVHHRKRIPEQKDHIRNYCQPRSCPLVSRKRPID